MIQRQETGYLQIPKSAQNAHPQSKKTGDAITCLAENVAMSFAGFVWDLGLNMARNIITVIDMKKKAGLMLEISRPNHEQHWRDICMYAYLT
jgi:hypothetical protein